MPSAQARRKLQVGVLYYIIISTWVVEPRGGRDAEELERIVSAMSRVTQKLQDENEDLKRNNLSKVKYMEAVNEAKRLKEQLRVAEADKVYPDDMTTV